MYLDWKSIRVSVTLLRKFLTWTAEKRIRRVCALALFGISLFLLAHAGIEYAFKSTSSKNQRLASEFHRQEIEDNFSNALDAIQTCIKKHESNYVDAFFYCDEAIQLYRIAIGNPENLIAKRNTFDFYYEAIENHLRRDLRTKRRLEILNQPTKDESWFAPKVGSIWALVLLFFGMLVLALLLYFAIYLHRPAATRKAIQPRKVLRRNQRKL